MKMKTVDFDVVGKDELKIINKFLKGSVHVDTEIKDGRVYIYAFYPDEIAKEKINEGIFAIPPQNGEKQEEPKKQKIIPCGNTACVSYNNKDIATGCNKTIYSFILCDFYIPGNNP